MNQSQNSVSTPAPGSNAATGGQQPNRGGGRRGGRGGRDGRGGGRGYFKKHTRERCNSCFQRGHHARNCPLSAGLEELGRMVIANRGGFGSRRRAGGRNRGGGGRAWYGNRQVRFGGAVTSVTTQSHMFLPAPAFVERPAAEQPAAEQPAAEEPGAEEPAAEEPGAEEPAAEQTAAEQTAAEQETGLLDRLEVSLSEVFEWQDRA